MKKIAYILILLCLMAVYHFWSNPQSIYKDTTPQKAATLIHSTGSTHFDEIYLCAGEDDAFYQQLTQQGKKCNTNIPTTITCDIQCFDITGFNHSYTVPERNLSFDLQYDKISSASDFLQEKPKNHLFTIGGTTLTGNITYDTTELANKTIIYTTNNTPYTTIINKLQSQGYMIEDYTQELNNQDHNIIAYGVSDRLLNKQAMPQERVFIFNTTITGYYYNVDRDIVSYSCNPGPCSSFSNINFFVN